jgi:hypothetical protein
MRGKNIINKKLLTLILIALFFHNTYGQYSILDAFIGHWVFKKQNGNMDLDLSKKIAIINLNDSQFSPCLVDIKKYNDTLLIDSINNKIILNLVKFKRKRRYSKLFIELFVNGQKYKLVAIREKDIQSYYWRGRFHSNVSCFSLWLV